MGNINSAYTLAISLCNKINPPCLYSMDYNTTSSINGLSRRMGGQFLSDPWLGAMGATQANPIQYFDCSGFISYILWKAGYYPSNPGFTTSYEGEMLKQAGFTVVPYTKGMSLRAGDIVWYDNGGIGHTEMVFNPTTRQTMGAAGRGTEWGMPPSRPADTQVRILNTNTDSIYNWQYIARDETTGGASLDWVYKDEYLTEQETLNNVSCAILTMVNQGYSAEAMAGIIGNMWAESGVEPWLTERGGGGGYGLVQWTPKSDLIQAVNRFLPGSDYTNGSVQCSIIAYECGGFGLGTNVQWYDIYPHKPPVPFTDFTTWAKRTTYSPEDMAFAFMAYYERPAWETVHLDLRQQYARRVYDIINTGMYNGQLAFNFGNNLDRNRMIYLIDYVRRKNSLKIQ